MKKLLPFLFALLMSFGGTVMAQQNVTEGTAATPQQAALAERYIEINNLDKSDMSNKEKRDLKKEQAQIEKELIATSDDPVVIYISSGVILVLLIILLIILL